MDSRMPGGDGIPSYGGRDHVAAADLLATFGEGPTADALTTVDASGDQYRDPQPDVAYHPDEGPPRVGHYHLIEEIGRGSQGEVWKAAQLRPRVQFVALKLLWHPEMRDPAKLARFRREAERGARLGHAAILPTYEFGEDAGVVFFAMPLIDGFTLGEVLDQRRLCRAGEPPLQLHRLAILPHGKYIDAMARVLARVAWALHHAHDSGVAHCDVKPSNILLDRADEEGCYLIDFGMGRDLDSMPRSPPSSVAGTVLYMAPEKLLGLPSDEVLCDVYALGATAYEAFALRPPRAVPERLPRRLWAALLGGARIAPTAARSFPACRRAWDASWGGRLRETPEVDIRRLPPWPRTWSGSSRMTARIAARSIHTKGGSPCPSSRPGEARLEAGGSVRRQESVCRAR